MGVYVVSGREDFLVHVAVADNSYLYGFVIDKLTERLDVADVRTSVIYGHLRNVAGRQRAYIYHKFRALLTCS